MQKKENLTKIWFSAVQHNGKHSRSGTVHFMTEVSENDTHIWVQQKRPLPPETTVFMIILLLNQVCKGKKYEIYNKGGITTYPIWRLCSIIAVLHMIEYAQITCTCDTHVKRWCNYLVHLWVCFLCVCHFETHSMLNSWSDIKNFKSLLDQIAFFQMLLLNNLLC